VRELARVVRIVAVAGVASIAAVLLFPAFLSLRAAGTKAFEPERFDYALLAIAVFCIATGAQFVPWRRSPYVALLAALASASLLFGVIASFSIGLAFVPAGIVFVLLLYRAIRRHEPRSATAAAIGGAFIGYAAVLLYIAQAVPATAQCFPNGAGTSSGRWPGSETGFATSGGGIVGNDGVFTGRSEYARSVVTFRCESGRLVEFQRIPR
jgi:hypothetical protein